MPRLMVELSSDEFDRLRARARDELRHPRQTARLILRDGLKVSATGSAQSSPQDVQTIEAEAVGAALQPTPQGEEAIDYAVA